MEPRIETGPDRAARAGRRLTEVVRRGLLLVAAAVLLGGCDGSGTQLDVDAPLVISLESPNGSEGAAMFELYGMGSAGLEAAGGTLYERRQGDTTRVIVVLDAPGSITVTSAGGRERSVPGWRILEVSDPANELRPSVEGYALRFGG